MLQLNPASEGRNRLGNGADLEGGLVLDHSTCGGKGRRRRRGGAACNSSWPQNRWRYRELSDKMSGGCCGCCCMIQPSQAVLSLQ